MSRCEGWVRHGGAFTLGPVEWKQCTNDGVVMIKVHDNPEPLPCCNDCWKRIESEAKQSIESVKPI